MVSIQISGQNTLRITTNGNIAFVRPDFTEAIKLRGGYADAYTGRGVVLHSQGDMKSALKDFDRALELIPTRPTPRYFRAKILFATGDLDRALADLDAALKSGSPDPPRRVQIESLRKRIADQLAGGQ